MLQFSLSAALPEPAQLQLECSSNHFQAVDGTHRADHLRAWDLFFFIYLLSLFIYFLIFDFLCCCLLCSPFLRRSGQSRRTKPQPPEAGEAGNQSEWEGHAGKSMKIGNNIYKTGTQQAQGTFACLFEQCVFFSPFECSKQLVSK